MSRTFARNDIMYWNGRNDSLWSQIVAVVESHVSVNGSRMRVAWRIVDKYKSEYQTLFPDYPRARADGFDRCAAGAREGRWHLRARRK